MSEPTAHTLSGELEEDPPPGRLPARYEDLGRIRRGGMGEVRRVRDLHLEPDVAMKILRGDALQDPAVRARFFAEARLTAGLQHPSVISVYDAGTLADGRVWFTMAEVRGQTLSSLIDELHARARAGTQTASVHGVLEAVATACDAVAHAHAAGVIHRDLKPDNIMVGAFREVAVLDWGIAHGASRERPVR
jgi:serine/threonine protein kinase